MDWIKKKEVSEERQIILKTQIWWELSKQLIEEIKIHPDLKGYIKTLQETGQELMGKPIVQIPYELFLDYYRTGNRLRYEALYFERRKRLMTFGLLAWLYDDAEAITYLSGILWKICSEYSWALPAHTDQDTPIALDLFACETAFAISEILYLLSERLDDGLVKKCHHEIRRRVLMPFSENKEGFSWEKSNNNWAAVCGASVGITAIYMEDMETLKVIHSRLRNTFQSYFEGFPSDGVCLEGLSYWTYGMGFFTAYCDLIESVLPGEPSLLDDEKWEQIACFQQKCYTHKGRTISFSDGSRTGVFMPGLTAFLANRFESVRKPPIKSIANYHSDSCYRWCHGFRNLVWTALYDQHESKDQAHKETFILNEAEWFIAHGESYGLAAKAGHNDEPHNHNDVGSFIFYKDGEDLLVDLGSGEYTKDYFGDRRYDIFCNRSSSHNLPLINGTEQVAGSHFKGVFLESDTNRIRMRLTDAYPSSNLNNYERLITIDGEMGLVLTDFFTFKEGGNQITERFICVDQPIISKRGVMISRHGISVCIQPVDAKLMNHVMIKPHDHYDHKGKLQKVYSINFDCRVETSQTILRFIIK